MSFSFSSKRKMRFSRPSTVVDEIRDVNIPAGAPIIALDSAGPQDAIAANNMSAMHRILG